MAAVMTLSEIDSNTLALILDEIIPPTTDGALPGAGALGIVVDIVSAVRATPDLGPVITKGLAALDGVARQRNAEGFTALSPVDRVQALRDVEVADPAFLPTVTMLAYVGYYGNERVLAALRSDTHPPHPQGYEVAADDLSLLDAVRSRPKLYRDC